MPYNPNRSPSDDPRYQGLGQPYLKRWDVEVPSSYQLDAVTSVGHIAVEAADETTEDSADTQTHGSPKTD